VRISEKRKYTGTGKILDKVIIMLQLLHDEFLTFLSKLESILSLTWKEQPSNNTDYLT